MSEQEIRKLFDAYIREVADTYADGDATEHSGRKALQTLLEAFAGDKKSAPVVRHEPKQVAEKGAPDFKVMKTGGILGYVENKAPGTDLNKILKSGQIKRYRSLSDNILLTDYLHWVWINKDGVQREALCYETDLENAKFSVKEDRAQAVAGLLEGFYSTAPEGISSAQTLALALATRSHVLRDFIGEELVRQEREHQEGRLFGLYQVFRSQVFHELSLKEFADTFAQTLAYGLFLARLNAGKDEITLHNAPQFIPASFRLIRELVDFLDVLDNEAYRNIRWVVEEVLSIVNGLDLAAIHEDLAFRNRRARHRVKTKDEEEWRLFSRDPFIYFYEDYLKAYDAKMRKGRGVYYTPPPVVNFIVRAIDDILKDTFKIEAGLADHKRVTVLDFACGTGTFLVEVLERIFETAGGPDTGKGDLLVKEHILKNIFGFEYLMAPYTIAHLKLSQYLKERGHELANDERFQVFLTNTLEPIEPQKNFLLPALTAETEAAQEVKDKPILVITGNPPYSGQSKNKGEWITAAIDDYKWVWETDKDGNEERKPLGEKNPKWLQDDYVKFIRFAQMKMDAVNEGIVGIITNHSFLDNPTFRGMRQSLMRTFDQIYVLDLHGNAKKKERTPEGHKDENVFDIEQGVAISLFIKKPGAEKGVWHSDFWGKKVDKYRAAMDMDLGKIEWQRVECFHPYFLFVPVDWSAWPEYAEGYSVADSLHAKADKIEIFPVNSVGIVTARDRLAIKYNREDIQQTIVTFASMEPEEARENYNLGKDARDWKVHLAQADIADHGTSPDLVQPIHYRPFDQRFTYYTGRSRGFLCMPRPGVMRHMLRENLGLITSRLTKGEDFAHVQVADTITEVICMSPTTSNNGFVFPLYLYPPDEGQKPIKADLFGLNDPFDGKDRIENLAPDFRAWIDARYGHAYTPEEIFGLIYAVLHAPAYRTCFRDFLRIDFPRIPFPEDRKAFETLSALGSNLIQTHLMRDLPDSKLGKYVGRGDHAVEKPRYVEAEQAIYINNTQHFAPVPPAVWEFRVGGYQVIDKYLKSRKGRTLSLDEINQVERITNVLAFTIGQMSKIDKAYSKAF